MSDEPTPAPAPQQGQPRPRPVPNYAARRMLVSTLAITVLVAGGLLAWRALDGGDDGRGGTAGTWDQVAFVDLATGDLTVVDDEGEQVGETVPGPGRVSNVHVDGERLALVLNDRIVVTGGDGEPTEVPIARSDEVTERWTDEGLALVIGDPTGGNVRIVDARSGAVLDFGTAAEQSEPLLFAQTVQPSSNGRLFAVADAANFQTIVVERDVPGATFYPDQPIAVSDQLVATSQVVGRQADIALYDRERRNQAQVPTEIPAGGVLDGSRLTVVSIDGTVYRIERGDEEAEQIGDVAVPAGAHASWALPSLGGERLVVAGSVSLAVVDLDGATVFSTTFAAPLAVLPPRPGWSCLPVGGANAYHSLISLEDGAQLADLTGLTVTGWSSDGCTVIGSRDGSIEVVGADGVVALGNVRGARLGPDGRTVLYATRDRRVELVTFDDELELGDPIDLTDLAPTAYAAVFLDS